MHTGILTACAAGENVYIGHMERIIEITAERGEINLLSVSWKRDEGRG